MYRRIETQKKKNKSGRSWGIYTFRGRGTQGEINADRADVSLDQTRDEGRPEAALRTEWEVMRKRSFCLRDSHFRQKCLRGFVDIWSMHFAAIFTRFGIRIP